MSFKPAFKSKTGQILTTGLFHDITCLPETFEIAEEGFVNDNGIFKNRHEVAEELHLDHDAKHEDLEGLEKVQRPPDLTQLGIEARPQTPITTPQQASTKRKLMVNAGANAGANVKIPAVKRGHFVAGLTGPAETGTAISYALKSPSSHAVQNHENLHLMFNRVQDKFGHSARQNLASNLYNSIPKEHRQHLNDYVKYVYGDKDVPAHRWYEEHLAHLVSYLNSYPERLKFHIHHGSWDHNMNGLTDKGKDFNIHMKQAYRHLQNASKKADSKWLKRFLHKAEYDLLMKDWQPAEHEIELALDMLHAFHDDLWEFKAAKFMAGGFNPTQDEIEQALREHEGDYEAAALMAHHLDINDSNIQNLRKLVHVMQQQEDLSKSEIEVAAIPRIVKPFDESDVPVAKIVKEAFENNEVHKIKLNGKHSKGTALVRDVNTGDIWLLKPGSGKLSPALGIKETKANQSRREVAFNEIAAIIGLGHYVPKAALLLLDGEEIAALQFFGGSYKPAEKVKKANLETLRTVFERMVCNGLLFKLVALDYVLGQVDRHFGNVLVSDENDVKLIDAGSTFAGPSFNPALDPKSSFVPCELRVFTARKWSVLTPQEKYKTMPTLSGLADQSLKYWLDNLPEGQIVSILNKYGIDPQPVVDRIKRINDFNGSKSEFLKKFFAGLE